MNAAEKDLQIIEIDDLEDPDLLPGVVSALGKLPPGTIINEATVAHIFKRQSVTTVKRAVKRGELPPPCKLFGDNVWTISKLLGFIENRLVEAARQAEELAAAVVALAP